MLRNSIVILVLALMVSFVACQEDEVTAIKEKTTTQKYLKNSEPTKVESDILEKDTKDLAKALLEMKDDEMKGVYLDTEYRIQTITGTNGEIQEAFAKLFPNLGYLYTNTACNNGNAVAFAYCIVAYLLENPSDKLRLRKEGGRYIAEVM